MNYILLVEELHDSVNYHNDQKSYSYKNVTKREKSHSSFIYKSIRYKIRVETKE